MKISIKSWLSGSILFETEAVSIKACLEIATGNRAESIGAYLKGAYLTGADLTGADLTGADLKGADLTGAYLTGADLTGADLKGADLTGADLTGAYLTGADLKGADLTGADLKGAYLTPIKHDFWAVLVCAVKEIPFLREAIIEGKIDGSAYFGDCACLVGTIANAKKCSYESIKILQPDSSRPAERFFLGITIGDTPNTSQLSKLALEWLDEFVANINVK